MSAAAVPLFDAARLREREPEELSRLRAALSTVGFCRVARHSIPTELIAELASCRRAFFAQPEAAKRRVADAPLLTPDQIVAAMASARAQIPNSCAASAESRATVATQQPATIASLQLSE